MSTNLSSKGQQQNAQANVSGTSTAQPIQSMNNTGDFHQQPVKVNSSNNVAVVDAAVEGNNQDGTAVADRGQGVRNSQNLTTQGAEPYDIQMDEFAVIDSKNGNQQSYMTSPHGISSFNQSAGVTQKHTLTNKSQQQDHQQQETGAQQNQQPDGANADDSAIKREDCEEDAPHINIVKEPVTNNNLPQQQEEQFFLTGVNVHNQDNERFALTDKPHEEIAEPQQVEQVVNEDLAQEEANAAKIDAYKMVSVVDAGRSFANNECVYVQMNKNEICHLSVNSHTSLQFDELISSYEQVFKIGKSMAHTFVNKRNTNKVVLNVADQFATNNNCGFNLANFKLKFLKNYYNEVVQDYERSFIGSFANALLSTYLPRSGDQFELYFTIAKFEGNMGYSLTQNLDEIKLEFELKNASQQEQHQFQTLSPTNQANISPHHVPQPGSEPTNGETTNLNETAEILEARHLEHSQANGNNQMLDFKAHQLQKLAQKQVQERRQEIMKKGSIPEFVQIKDTHEFYKVYQEANYRNKLLVESQKAQQLENIINGSEPIDQNNKATSAGDTENSDLKNIKDDTVIMQFKLVRKDTMKIINTQTFINLPISKTSDINISTLMEIIQKQNSSVSAQQQKRSGAKKDSQFLPYNKSILTRILYPCLNKCNFLVINHFSKKTILKHLKQPITGYQAGPAKGLFSSLFKLGFDTLNRLKKKKLQQQQALKVLQKQFKSDLAGIFKEIDMFRCGIKSFEVYTEQTANQLAKGGNPGGTHKATPLTMFHQIMYFLVLQEEMTADAETFGTNHVSNNNSHVQSTNFFPSLLPEEEIQKVIFDQNYLDYIAHKRQMEHQNNFQYFDQAQQVSQQQQQNINLAQNEGVYSNDQETKGNNPAGWPGEILKSQEEFGGSVANTSVQQAAMMAKDSQMPQLKMQQAAHEKEKKLQFVQYECIKSELKEEYDKRVGFLHKRLNKKAQVDPSFMLLNNLTTQPISTKNGRGSMSQGGSSILDNAHEAADRAKQLGQQLQLQKKILSGPKSRLAKSKTSQGAPLSHNQKRRAQMELEIEDDRKQSKQQRQAEYYKFYLDNAQKAIDLMIQQHKSVGSLSSHQNQQLQSRGGGLRSNSNGRAAISASSQGTFVHQDDQILHMHGSVDQVKFHPTNINVASAQRINYSGYSHGGRQTGKRQHPRNSIYDGASQMNVNRSNSLHERKFNPGSDFVRNQQRLEPLVSRHTKISRISVRNNHNMNSQEGDRPDKHLEKIDEQSMYKNNAYVARLGGSIGPNQRRNKPFSANQNTKVRVMQDSQGMPQAASTHYTSFKPTSAVNTQNIINNQTVPMNGTIMSSNDSTRYGLTEGRPGISKQQILVQQSGKTSQEDIRSHQAQDDSAAANQILNYNSDQNLHERRPVTSSNEMMIPQVQRLKMNMSEDQNSAIYRLNQARQEKIQKGRGNSGAGIYQNNNKTFNHGKKSHMLPPAGPSYHKHQTAANSTTNSNSVNIGTGQPANTAKRLLTNGAAARRCVRGELLTNGYKSLRAQGMLRAQKIEADGGGDYIESGTTPVQSSSKKHRKNSKELEHVNICIEQTYTNADAPHLTGHKSVQNSAESKKVSKKHSASPLKVNPNLVPKGCAPKNRNQKYEPLKNSRTSNMSHVKNSKDSADKISSQYLQQQSVDPIDGIQDIVRGSVTSQDIVDYTTSQNATVMHQKAGDSSGLNASGSITTQQIQASGHIGESTLENGSVENVILVQDNSKLSQPLNTVTQMSSKLEKKTTK